MSSDPETRPDVSYTREGNGVIAACKGCGWETWRVSKPAAEAAVADHKKCRAEDIAFLKRHRLAQSASRP